MNDSREDGWTPPSFRARPCNARTRAGAPCRGPAVTGRKRCRMHGGAPGSGAPRGNSNRLIHGIYTAGAIEERRRIARLIRESLQVMREIKAER